MAGEEWRIEQPEPEDMMAPGQCLRCRRVYDLCRVKVIHNYSDCTLFYAPCCGAQVDSVVTSSMTCVISMRLTSFG